MAKDEEVEQRRMRRLNGEGSGYIDYSFYLIYLLAIRYLKSGSECTLFS